MHAHSSHDRTRVISHSRQFGEEPQNFLLNRWLLDCRTGSRWSSAGPIRSCRRMNAGVRWSIFASLYPGGNFAFINDTRSGFPFYDRRVLKIIQTIQPDLIHVHNRPLLALYLQKHLGGRIPLILHLHNLYNSLGKRERPPIGTPIPVAGCVACSQFVLDRERTRLGFRGQRLLGSV